MWLVAGPFITLKKNLEQLATQCEPFEKGICFSFNEGQSAVNGQIPVGINMNVQPALVLIQPLIVLRNWSLVQPHSIKILFLKAVTQVKLLGMLPFLHILPNHQMVDQLFIGFGFPLPAFSGEGCLMFDNLPLVRCFGDILAKKNCEGGKEGRVVDPFYAPPFVNFKVSSPFNS